MSLGTELLNAPLPELVKTLGVGIAEAQFELDLVSTRIARLMAGYQEPAPSADQPTPDPQQESTTLERSMLVKLGDGKQYSLLELGFTPTFYQFVDTLIELKMSISMTRETEVEQASRQLDASLKGSVGFFSASAKMRVSTVSASYAAKYQYSAEGSSLMRTKLVPVPAPAILEERIRAMATPTSTEKS